MASGRSARFEHLKAGPLALLQRFGRHRLHYEGDIMRLQAFNDDDVVALEALPLLIVDIGQAQVEEVLNDRPFRFFRLGLFHWSLGEHINKFFNLEDK